MVSAQGLCRAVVIITQRIAFLICFYWLLFKCHRISLVWSLLHSLYRLHQEEKGFPVLLNIGKGQVTVCGQDIWLVSFRMNREMIGWRWRKCLRGSVTSIFSRAIFSELCEFILFKEHLFAEKQNKNLSLILMCIISQQSYNSVRGSSGNEVHCNWGLWRFWSNANRYL